MIGQENLVRRIDDMVLSGRYPRFSIIEGAEGSGRHLMAQLIASRLKAALYPVDPRIDAVRAAIRESHRMSRAVCYVIYDADTALSIQARNALLKVTEEPSNMAYFIATAQNVENVLATIKSRGVVLRMDVYTPDQLAEFACRLRPTWAAGDDAVRIVRACCDVPGDVVKLLDVGVHECYEYVRKVVQHVGTVSGTNAFKIGNTLKLTGSDSGCDLKLFWRVFMCVCRDFADQDAERMYRAITVTSGALRKLAVRGINTQMLFDAWLLDVREVMRNDG